MSAECLHRCRPPVRLSDIEGWSQITISLSWERNGSGEDAVGNMGSILSRRVSSLVPPLCLSPRARARSPSLVRNNALLGPYSRAMPMALWWFYGRAYVSVERLDWRRPLVRLRAHELGTIKTVKPQSRQSTPVGTINTVNPRF